MVNTAALLARDEIDTAPKLEPLNLEVADLQPVVDEVKAFINRRAVREFREWRQTKLEREDVMDAVVEGLADDIDDLAVADELSVTVSPCLRDSIEFYKDVNGIGGGSE